MGDVLSEISRQFRELNPSLIAFGTIALATGDPFVTPLAHALIGVHVARHTLLKPELNIAAILAVRERSRGRAGFAAERPLLCPAPDRLPYGPVWTRPPYPAR
jgi:hypothetical protein